MAHVFPSSGSRSVSSRSHLAQLTASLGAGVLGLGLGVLFSRFLEGFGIVILIVGAVMHVWGMFDGMRLEREARSTRPAWSLALYWLCWALLAALALYVGTTVIR